MAHMIDTTTGKAAMAYVGEAPWHGLGQNLTPGASLDVWRREAGLAYDVQRTEVLYTLKGEDASAEVLRMSGRDVLYRTDTNAALSVVSKDYKVVQPSEVLEFFGKLSAAGGFELETAGALSDGKRIWALAKVGEGAPVIGHDVVRPYVLLATSYDGTMATVAKFTAVRVVCNNTLTMAAGAYDPASGKHVAGESDVLAGPGITCVKVPHALVFNPDQVRLQLGIVNSAWERFLVVTQALAQVRVTDAQADALVFDLLSAVQRVPAGRPLPDVRKSKGYAGIMDLFHGGAIGAELTGGDNAWALLNACTELVDHHRGKSDNTRLESAWFGAGEGLKNDAFKRIVKLAKDAGALAV